MKNLAGAVSALFLLLNHPTATANDRNIFRNTKKKNNLETILPPSEEVNESNPVRLFIQAGQSNCGGKANATLLMADEDTYPDHVNTIDHVWYAGEFTQVNDILIRPMVAGEAKNLDKFGPEVSIGQRLAEASGNSTHIMIAKYCSGGSNLKYQWNPETDYNNWNRENDDGTSDWLLDNGWAVLNSKNNLYANLVYTVRKITEMLDDASMPYKYSGFFWIQGSADKEISTWQEYADDTVRLFDTLRSDLNESYLPIVDKGGSPHHNLFTGKMYAASVIPNGGVSVADYNMASANPDSCCIPGPSNVCLNSTFINFDLFEHYGYDPAFEDASKPEGATDKEFHWFASYPTDQHFEYEGMILRGQLMANAYLRDFSPDWAGPLTIDMEANDPQILFPVQVCPEGEKPTNENICMMDQSLDTTPVVELDCTETTCTGDEDAVIVRVAEARNIDGISGCADVAVACARNDEMGEFVRKFCCATCGRTGCVDDEAALAQAAAQNGFENAQGCSGTVNACGLNDARGDFVRATCCATCSSVNNNDNRGAGRRRKPRVRGREREANWFGV